MGDLSAHFNRREFACKCGCGFDTVDAQLLEACEAVRQYFGASVTISSGCRCAARNKLVGGSPKSQHLLGRAADITVHGVPAADVAQYLERAFLGRFGIGRYPLFTHIDARNNPARWSES